MSITIQASGVLRQHVAPGHRLEGARTVGEAITRLGLPDLGELIMLVNGRPAHWQTELEDGDVLHLVPGISGGCDWPVCRQESPANR